MRIALLCPNASSNSLVRTYPIAKVLARKHRLQVLGFRFGDGIFPPYRDEFDYETRLARGMPAFVRQVQELASRVEADAIYAFKALPSSVWVGLLARQRLGAPLFLDLEDWEAGWYYDVPTADAIKHLLHVERPNGLLWTWLTERLVRRCDDVFVVSRFLQRRFGGTLLVHGADTSQFDPTRWDMAEARRRLGLGDGRYVVFTGAPMPNKGLGDLLEAVAALGDRALKVLVVGSFAHDPAYRDRLLSAHGDRLIIVGPQPHAEMPLYLAAADLVALPQQVCRVTVAQVPGKVFEAMAMARPILATAVGDLTEILDGCGVVVPPGSPDALLDGLARILHSPDEARALGENARRRCEERYSWDSMERVLDERLAKWVRT
jgi:glycosyltransferase involved in cell wall biosynthesis